MPPRSGAGGWAKRFPRRAGSPAPGRMSGVGAATPPRLQLEPAAAPRSLRAAGQGGGTARGSTQHRALIRERAPACLEKKEKEKDRGGVARY